MSDLSIVEVTLKPCPFPECDGTRPAVRMIGNKDGWQAVVECDCGARGPMTPTYQSDRMVCRDRARQEAARLWNTRASTASEAERVREACAKVADECRAAFERERSRTLDGEVHWYFAGKRDGAISIAAAIRSLPIGGAKE